MKIAVLSGKGGAGKTLVSVNLAAACENSTYVDCDVEEPNGHIFFKPVVSEEYPINVMIPVCDANKCTGCRECVNFCKFNALAYVNDNLMVFEDICHSCGGCSMVCPEGAITEKPKAIGMINIGNSGSVRTITGIMNTGEESGVPIINELLEKAFTSDGDIFIDCPPGSSCSVMESIKDADFCVLVIEPTIMGLHDFKMVHELVTLFNKPHGIVLNKVTDDYNPSEQYCLDNDLNILAKIPFDNELGKLNSDGKIVTRENDRFKKLFADILSTVEKEAVS